MDIYSRLLKDRIVFIGTVVNDEVANAVVAQLLFLQSEDAKADVNLYINSPGGSSPPDWRSTTRCNSSVATWLHIASEGRRPRMGARAVDGGDPRNRYALPNARIMIHQPLAGHGGSARIS